MKKIISCILKSDDHDIKGLSALEQIICSDANELVDKLKEKKENYLLSHLKLDKLISYDGFNIELEENVEVYEMYFIEF